MPEQSTIVNPLAYKTIALDFLLWAKTGVASSGTSSSNAKVRIPLVHLDHFTTLLVRSRYRTFNWAIGLGEGFSSSRKKEKDADKSGLRGGGKGSRGISLVRKMLFALQMGWYGDVSNNLQHTIEGQDMTQYLINALGVVLQAPGGFGKEDVKAIIAYLAANLIEGETFFMFGASKILIQAIAEDAGKTCTSSMGKSNSLQVHQEDRHVDGATTPQSAASHLSFAVSFKNLAATSPRANAEKILELLIHILSDDSQDAPQLADQTSYYHKFSSYLPINRILLLLLGEHPTSHSAALILRLIGVGIARSPSFIRKFELVSGWNVLKVVLPSTSVWDSEVDEAAWDLLLGNIRPVMSSKTLIPTSADARNRPKRSTEVHCPQILPTILCAFRTGLVAVAESCRISDDAESEFMLQYFRLILIKLCFQTETLCPGQLKL